MTDEPTVEVTTSTTPTPETTPSDPPSLIGQPPAPVEPEAPALVPLTAEALKFPEGVTVDDASRDSLLEIMNNQDLSAEARAQALVDLHTKVQQAASEASSQAWADMQGKWQDEVRADPDIGGAKLEPVLADVAKVIDQFGSPELREVMDLTGAGNNVHVIKFLANVAKQLNEGVPVSGAPADVTPASLAEMMYPSMAKK